MRLLPGVDQVVLLQVSQLSEAFVTGLTLERSLTAVHSKVNLHGRENLFSQIQISENISETNNSENNPSITVS